MPGFRLDVVTIARIKRIFRLTTLQADGKLYPRKGAGRALCHLRLLSFQ
jgi:hypothetical protein